MPTPFVRAAFALRQATVAVAALTLVPALPAQAPTNPALTGAIARAGDPFAALHWRNIGPVRAGRARALAGVPSQPNVFYAGFDNGGVWRTTDYGSTWRPLFDNESTGSIGAIAVAPSDPNIIYVGSGAGIIRPDLATGNGVYKSTDAGRTWTHLGLDDSQMIAMIDVDPRDANRLFVAVLGHPYGPNAERGIFRSLDGGRSFQKVLYKDEYTSANDVRIDPSDPSVVYATLWQQQQSYIEGQAFGGTGNGIFKSTDGGTTWRQLTSGLPAIIQANLAIAPSNSKLIYATIAGTTAETPKARMTTGDVGFYKSTDAGEHWALAGKQDPRPMVRIGGGDLPTIAVDPKHEQVVYSSSTVFWRTEDGGTSWSAVRGAPGGDDYQKTWINPLDPNIILAVSDQGAVVSANRGVSWSNWYNQSTAAMYHVSTDNAFPYRVCGGQQDSGSACVESRSSDGEITFHDWHPANIQEYGIAAPDPRDPDKVYGSARTNVSLYDRRTAQTSLVGPSTEARGTLYNRNVRTMPIAWAPQNPDVLYYTSNVVWKSTDHAHRWTRISPDLARSTWAVPASAGKYAAGVTPAPMGSITAFSPSPKDAKVLWAGTDDGVIQVTKDGGATWASVTPAAIKPWTRIFNIEAGHFAAGTAYAAANTLRIDDLNPHLWRTRDGGRSWTEINTGIARGAVTNTIREDPRTPGLLYAGTDAQVWVSFDDGDHWQSLRIDMPAISVRDLELKDDSSCVCSDLIAGTHGRGYWILDNVTPLRQAMALAHARDARVPFLYKPAVAVRIRVATNDPTPWPPEVPAGENPLPGAIIDYALPNDLAGPVRLEILDSRGKLVRSYSSADALSTPDPAMDAAGYDRLCQQTPALSDCALPLYWPAPRMAVSARSGMHRFSWDMRYDPITKDTVQGSDDDATGAVPHHTYPAVNAPWAPPGSYTVRLTADGHVSTQPLTLRLDPRVRTPAATLARVASLTRELYDGAAAAHAAHLEARALSARLTGASDAGRRAQVDSLAPATATSVPARARTRRSASAFEGSTLESASAAMLNAAMAMQAAEVAPTADQLAAADRAKAQYAAVVKRWRALLRGRDG